MTLDLADVAEVEPRPVDDRPAPQQEPDLLQLGRAHLLERVEGAARAGGVDRIEAQRRLARRPGVEWPSGPPWQRAGPRSR